ncbi:BLUF domain-containing protein [Mucilaginibacter sp. CSA2-8R]|uniref:BLUF domain-containing protein n=1 Tax=Mucilaginibacter sp. CSA2-8R TaxID=3141542 RepID=UPI00315CEEAD
MYTIIYISKALKPFADDELLDLLSYARKNNADNHLSGMLLYVKQRDANDIVTGRFIQALEGEEHEVTALYETIKRDSRHQQVTLLHQGPISLRSFTDWTMGFRSLLEDEYVQIPGFIKLDDQFTQSKSLLSLGVALNFMKSFYSIQT